MEVVFCDTSTLLPWVVHQITAASKRTLSPSNDIRSFDRTCRKIDDARDNRRGVCCTYAAAADMLTQLFKGPNVFTGSKPSFITRKRDVEEAAKLISSSVILLGTTDDHFRRARELFLAYCVKEIKDAYAQFSDYLDSAIVLQPPQGITISRVCVGHGHIPYILAKSDWRGLIIR